MGKKTDLEELRRELAEARADIAALRAWMQGHTCAQPYWPAPVQPSAPWVMPYTITTPCTCGQTAPCMLHGATVTSQPGVWVSPVTTTSVSTSGVNMTLRQVWPPKPDDPDMGVPALA